MVEVMKIIVTSFKKAHARTAACSAPKPAAGHHRPWDFWTLKGKKVFRKEKLSSSRIHCCYIILKTEFKLSCLLCNHQSLKKQTFYVTKECRGKKKMFVISSSLRIPDHHLCFKRPRPLSPPRGTLELLSTCLGIDSFIPLFSFRRIMLSRERSIIFIP